MQKLCCLLCIWMMLCGVSLAQDDEKSGYEIALERIEEARLTGATRLEFNNLGLTELPPEIGQLKSLKFYH